MIITIDGGTTNTRFYMADQSGIIAARKISMGIRDTVVQGIAPLRSAAAACIWGLMEETSIIPEAVVASGMIGSENGLFLCPHLTVPIDASGLAGALCKTTMPDIGNFPFYFVPGVKTFSEGTETLLREMDIMRGEETELFGIRRIMNITGKSIFVLPGSHLKVIDVDGNGFITGFRTSLSGELLRAVSEHTLLSASLRGVYPDTADEKWLAAGCDYARMRGLPETLFKVRILSKYYVDVTPERQFSFLLGAILQMDADMLAEADQPIYIGGSNPFRDALYMLLRERADVNRILPEISDTASSAGAVLLYDLMMSSQK